MSDKKPYDATLACMAGNIAGTFAHVYPGPDNDEHVATRSVAVARAILAELSKPVDPVVSVRHLVSAMRKLLPSQYIAEMCDYLDPLGGFIHFLEHESRSPDGDGPPHARNAEHDNAADNRMAGQCAVSGPPPATGGRCGQPTPEARSTRADSLPDPVDPPSLGGRRGHNTEHDTKGVMPSDDDMHVRHEQSAMPTPRNADPAVAGAQHPVENTATDWQELVNVLVSEARDTSDDEQCYHIPRQIVDAIEARLDAEYGTPPPPQGWQPIETAPKDGTLVLGFSGRSKGASFQVTQHGRYGWLGIPGQYAWSPTHWMELPPPPGGAVPEREK